MEDKEVEYTWKFPRMYWDRTYGVRDAARLINRSVWTIRHWRRIRRLPPCTIGYARFTPLQIKLMRGVVEVMDEWAHRVSDTRRRTQALNRVWNTLNKHWRDDDARFHQEQGR